jgi:hypothetical protein
LQALHRDGKLAPELSRLHFAPQRAMFELYDLKDDPNESKNLFGTKEAAEVQGELMATLQEWMILKRDFCRCRCPCRRRRPRTRASEERLALEITLASGAA